LYRRIGLAGLSHAVLLIQYDGRTVVWCWARPVSDS